MSKHYAGYLLVALSYLVLFGCSKNQAEEIKPDLSSVPPGTKITYATFVQPLLQSNCASCHAPGKPQAVIWSFNGYSSVVNNADRIKEQVLVLKTMPFGGSLSAADLKSLKSWFDQGMPQ